MKRGHFFAMIAVVILLLVSGCTTVHSSMREPNARVEFTKGDFTFSDQVSASATSTTIFLVDWNRIFKQETGSVEGSSIELNLSMVPVIGAVVVDKTANFALYELMKKNPGYDVVFYPQFETKVFKPVLGIGFIFKTTEVKATARLAKIK